MGYVTVFSYVPSPCRNVYAWTICVWQADMCCGSVADTPSRLPCVLCPRGTLTPHRPIGPAAGGPGVFTGGGGEVRGLGSWVTDSKPASTTFFHLAFPLAFAFADTR